MNYLATSCDGGGEGILGEEGFDAIIRSDDEPMVTKLDSTAFNLARTGPFVGPNLKIMTKSVSIEIVQNNGGLSIVSVEPFVLSFNIRIGVERSCEMSLARSRTSVDPYTANAMMLIRLSHDRFETSETVVVLNESLGKFDCDVSQLPLFCDEGITKLCEIASFAGTHWFNPEFLVLTFLGTVTFVLK